MLSITFCCSAYGGYVVGLGTTIVVMNVFEAAQPALLYIVPAVLAAVLGHAALNKQFREVICLCSACQYAFPSMLCHPIAHPWGLRALAVCFADDCQHIVTSVLRGPCACESCFHKVLHVT